MRELKHTPGPWDNNSQKTVVRATESAEWIADVGGRNTLEAINNARLIAAAPDLLSSAESVIREICDYENMTDEAATAMRGLRAAIANAKGE